MSTNVAEPKVVPSTESLTFSPRPAFAVLRGVSFRQYLTIRNHPDNDGLRLTYHNGTLEIMSPQSAHERPSYRFGLLIFLICQEFGITFEGTGSTTLSKEGEKEDEGYGKEPDESFYFTNIDAILNKKGDMRVDQGDPPPDLWIEVDNRSSSAGKLPLYAALGVPEIWRFRAETGMIWFGKLVDGKYQAIDHSLSLPMLTPAHVQEMMALGRDVATSTWAALLQPWMVEHLKSQS